MSVLLINGNALQIPLADESVHCVVTSPPYWSLRDYGVDGQLGLEQTPEEYVANMVAVFREVRRVLREDGTCWVNLGDSYFANPAGKPSDDYVVNETIGDGVYARRYRNNHDGTLEFDKDARRKTGHKIDGLKPKDLVGIPWRVAFALQADGWWLRSDIIWSKPNPMPESVTDRPTKAHEYLFLLAKSQKYYYDADAIREEYAPASLPRALRGLSEDNKWSDGAPGSTAHTMSQSRPNQRKEWEAAHGGGGSGFDGHSGYVDANGRLLVNPNGRNKRTVWEIATAPYSGAHFATYPPALVEPCIKAGTSERGVCPVCGKGWMRVVDHTNMVIDKSGNHPPELRTRTSGKMVSPSSTITTGWQPTCAHDAEPVPAVVFDPFAGSGTTLLVARKLGRHGIGLDLSVRYLVENARERLELDRLDAWGSDGKKDGKVIDDLPLFISANNEWSY